MTIPVGKENLWLDFAGFTKIQMANQDVDPLYPILKHVEQGMDEETALWYSILYVAFYDISSSHRAFQVAKTPMALPSPYDRLPTGTERRAHRGGRINPHLLDIQARATAAGGLKPLLAQGLDGDAKANWNRARANLEAIRGNGRWASYKTVEILQKTHGWHLEPTDLGNYGSTGPRHGLELLFGPLPGNTPDAISVLDARALELMDFVKAEGAVLDLANLETVLCDFSSMCSGRYYPGNDTDELLHGLLRYKKEEMEPIWAARAVVLPRAYLGEFGGWVGTTKERRQAYAKEGKILVRT